MRQKHKIMRHSIFFILNILFLAAIIACSNETELEGLSAIQDSSCQTNSTSDRFIELPDGMILEKIDSFYVFQGDVYFTEEDVKQMRSSRACVQRPISRWPYIIPYEFAPGFANVSAVEEAIEHWTQATNLTFIPRTSQSTYMRFVNCANPYKGQVHALGMPSSGARIIEIGSSCDHQTAMHEIGHALGLIHEHCRPDRDNYITINFNNIKDEHLQQFNKYSTRDANTANATPFDYESIMMYASNNSAMAKNSSIAIMTRNDDPSLTFGATNYLSTLDQQLFNNYLYPNNKYHISGESLAFSDCNYRYSVNAPVGANVNWSLSANSGAYLMRNQDSRKITVMMPSTSKQFTLTAEIVSTKGYPNKTASFNISAASCPQFIDIQMYKYWQEQGEYTLQAIVNDPEATISWDTDGTIYDIPYPEDAQFLEYPNLFAAVDFYETGIHTVNATATNDHGSSTFSKTFLVEDAKSMSMHLAPNPSTDGIVTMAIKGSLENKLISQQNNSKQLNIYSNGKLIHSQELNSCNAKLNLSFLKNGKYIIEFVESPNSKIRQVLYINKKS